MSHSVGLREAINSITGDSDLTLEQRLDLLGQEIIANAFFLIEKANKGQEATKEEKEEQQEMIDRFMEIDKVFTKLRKANRVGSNSSFDKDLLSRIKDRKSSISGIVIDNTNSK